MTYRIYLKLAEILVPVILAITIYVAWQADRRDRAQLAAQLAAAQKTIDAAAASQHDRDTLLTQTLAQLAAQKQSTVTPAQVLKALPNAITLPLPITLQPQASTTTTASPTAQSGAQAPLITATSPSADHPNARFSSSSQSPASPSNPIPNPNQPDNAVLPAADLKPLYDFALDCKACQARLAAAQSDLNDEKTKTAALTKERDAALTAAKGGSVLHRIARAFKWFVIGAAAGAIAAKAAH